MKMKNFNYLRSATRASSLVFLFVLVGLVACNKDSDPAPTGVEGDWEITAININPAFLGITDLLPGYTGDNCPSQTTFSFKSNGDLDITTPSTCTATIAQLTDAVGIDNSTTWEVEGDEMTLTTGNTFLKGDLAVNATTMSLAQSGVVLPDGKSYTVTLVFKRK
jgi:hypothetical protein